MSLEYKIHVSGILHDGHPMTSYFSSLEQAARIFDSLLRKYPHHDITLSECKESVLKFSKGKERIVECPKGHTGLVNNKPVMLKGSKGTYNCQICGSEVEG